MVNKELIEQSNYKSSTAHGGSSNRAVDGTTSGIWGHGSVTPTANESDPWLQVDLGSRKTVYGVTLWNRTDCCTNRLSNVRVTYLNKDKQIVDIKDYPRTAGTKTNIVSMKSGVRYVKVELLGSGILSLAELQVWGHWDDQSFSSDYIPAYGAQDNDTTQLQANHTSKTNAAFKSAHNKYLVAESNGNTEVNANRSGIGSWETFDIELLSSGSCITSGANIAINTQTGYYLRATSGGGLDAKASSIGSWEQFTLINHSDSSGCLANGDSISLKSTHNKYVVAESNW